MIFALYFFTYFNQVLSDWTNAKTSGDVYVFAADPVTGFGTGTNTDPFAGILIALHCMTDTGTIHLSYEVHKTFEDFDTGARTLDSTPAWRTPLDNKPEGIVITIKTLTCQQDSSLPCSDTERSTIQYQSEAKFSIAKEFEVKFENVIFSGQIYFKDDCDQEWCTHCHDIEKLTETNSGSESEGKNCSMDSTECKTAVGELVAGDDMDFLKNNLLRTQSEACGLQQHVSDDIASARYLFLIAVVGPVKFSSDTSNPTHDAKLVFENVKFSNFRMRLSSLIHLYNGELKLENVDFEFLEPSQVGMDGEVQARGVITAAIAEDWENEFDNDHRINCRFEQTLSSTDVRPCSKVTWTGGSITGLNRDINYVKGENDKSDYSGFMDITAAYHVQIENVNFHDNLMPTIYGENPLLKFTSCGRIEFSKCTFTRNIVQAGLIGAQFFTELIRPNELNNEQLSLKNWAFEYNELTSSEEDIRYALILVESNAPINIFIGEFDESTPSIFEYNYSKKGNQAILIKLEESFDDKLSYADGNPEFQPKNYSAKISLDPVKIAMKGLQMHNNYFYSIFDLVEYPNFSVEKTSFHSNGAFGMNEAYEDYVFYYYATTEGEARLLSASGSQVLNEPSENLPCQEILSFHVTNFNIVSSDISHFTVENNTCERKIMKIESQRELVISYFDFKDNTCADENVGCLQFSNTEASITFDNCQFVNNTSISHTASGAVLASAVYPADGTLAEDPGYHLYINECTFQGNRAGLGNSLIFMGTYLKITNSTFAFNESYERGSAVYIIPFISGTSAEIQNCEFVGNVCKTTADISVVSADINTQVSLLVSDSSFTESQGDVSWINVNAQNISVVIENNIFTGSKSNSGALGANQQYGVFIVRNNTFSKFFGISPQTYVAQGTSSLINCAHGPNQKHSGSSDIETYISFENNTISESFNDEYQAIIGMIADGEIYSKNNRIYNNQGSAFMCQHGKVFDEGSQIYDNIGAFGVAFFAFIGCEVTLDGTVMQNNKALTNGGAIDARRLGTQLIANNITVTGNQAVSKGGGVFIENSAFINISDSTITNNSAPVGSAFYLVQNENENISILRNCTISENVGEGVIYSIDSKLQIYTSIFSENVMSDESPGIIALLSSITTNNCVFQNQECTNGCFIEAFTRSNYTDNGSQFKNAFATGYGGVARGSNKCRIEFNNSIIRNITGNTIVLFGGADESEFFLSNVDIQELILSGGRFPMIGLLNSDISINRGSRISGFNNTLILSERARYVFLDDVKIENGEASMNGAIMSLVGVANTTVINSIFRNNTAKGFGGSISSTSTIIGSLTVINWIFENSTAKIGGAIYSESSLFVQNSQFLDNRAYEIKTESSNEHASGGKGGAIYFAWAGQLACNNSYIQNSSFSNNWADQEGGAISWSEIEPYISNLTYENNYAIYGPNVASFPISVSLQIHNRIQRGLQDSAEMMIVASGQENLNISALLIDHYGALCTTYNRSETVLFVNQNNATWVTATVSGLTTASSHQGIANFEGFSVRSFPGSNTTMLVVSDDIDENKLGAVKYNTILVSLRECIYGERYLDGEWVECGKNFYTKKTNSTICSTCPSGVKWQGGAKVFPQNCMWRSDHTSSNFVECLNCDACIGQDNGPSLMGGCADGYYGNSWGSCIEGYSRTGRYNCQQCPETLDNIVRVAGLTIIIIIVIVLFVRETIKTAHRPQEIYSIYFKIMVSYLQVAMLIASFDLNWPSSVQEVLDTQYKAGAVGRQLFSYDCLMDSDNRELNVFYKRLVLISVYPILCIIIPFIFFGIVACKQRSRTPLTRQCVTTVIIILFIIQTDVVLSSLEVFACFEIDNGEYWLMADMEIRCGDAEHSFFALGAALPAIILWGFGIPFAALIVLRYYRHRLYDNQITYIRTKLGFLYLGYKPHLYYWEIIIMYRKLIIACISVSLVTQGPELQCLWALIVLLIAIYIQKTNMPYNTDELNRLETVSIAVSIITIYCGLFYLTEKLEIFGKFFFFACIVLSNLLFLCMWLQGMAKALLLKLAAVDPKLARRYCRCFKFVKYACHRYLETLPQLPADFAKKLSQEEVELLNRPGAFLEYIYEQKKEQAVRDENPDNSEETEYEMNATTYSPNQQDYCDANFLEVAIQNNDDIIREAPEQRDSEPQMKRMETTQSKLSV